MSRCHRLFLTPKIFKLNYLYNEDLASMKSENLICQKLKILKFIGKG